MTGSLLAPLFALLLLIPARIVVQRVSGQDAIDGMDDNGQNKDDRYPNEYVLPVHTTPREVEN